MIHTATLINTSQEILPDFAGITTATCDTPRDYTAIVPKTCESAICSINLHHMFKLILYLCHIESPQHPSPTKLQRHQKRLKDGIVVTTSDISPSYQSSSKIAANAAIRNHIFPVRHVVDLAHGTHCRDLGWSAGQ